MFRNINKEAQSLFSDRQRREPRSLRGFTLRGIQMQLESPQLILEDVDNQTFSIAVRQEDEIVIDVTKNFIVSTRNQILTLEPSFDVVVNSLKNYLSEDPCILGADQYPGRLVVIL